MKTLMLLAGAALMISGTPAIAQGQGHGKSHAAKAQGKAHAKAHGKAMKSNAKASKRLLRDRDRDGLDDRDEALARKYGGALCPPGLYKKTPRCMPPGLANRPFREGQRLSRNFGYYTPYSNIPLSLRDRYDLDDDYRYIYRNNVIYQVDPTTRLIRDVIDAVL